jgi:xanthine dehydrogenase molybdenum-binding subunit
VQMTMSRSEVLQSTGPTAGSVVKVKMGATREGVITAAQASFAFEGGAYSGAPISGACAATFPSYTIENVLIDGYGVVTNKATTSPYRAPGAPIVTFAVESVVDELAEGLQLDPMDFRLRNVAMPGTRRADGVRNGPIGAREVMTAVRDHPHYSAPPNSPRTGRGVAMGFCRNNSGMACVVANVMPNGTVSLVEGSVDIGGSRTAIAQQFAETLGLPVEDVLPSIGSTDSIGFTSSTGGSGVVFKSGWAAVEAAKDVCRQFRQRAALLWEVEEGDVEFAGGLFKSISVPGRELSFKEVAAALPQTGGPVVGRANLNPAGSVGSYAATIVDVEVDPETGKVQVLRLTAFQDAGRAIHPSYVEGQMQGGAAQGIGWALNEEYVMHDGVMVNDSLLDYRMPTALDLPMIDTVVVEVPNPGHPFGAKGVGEANIVPPLAAVANAIYRATGARMNRLPMNPQAVVAASTVAGDDR